MFRIPGDPDIEAGAELPVARQIATGSAAPAVGEEVLSAAVELPWDDWLGAGATERIRDGSLGVVRHAYPATAARDMRAAATPAGMLQGDAADRERLGAVALAVAAAHARPARMPTAAGAEPHAWWLAEERALVWMPWSDAGESPYGLELLSSGQADAVTVTAPDAVWTVFRTELPQRGARGRWGELPDRFREAVRRRAGARAGALERGAHWRREGDTIVVRWRDDGRVRSASIAVNRPDPRG